MVALLDAIEKLELSIDNSEFTREEVLRKACGCVHELIPKANLVSLWRFNEDRSSIISLVNYDATTDKFNANVRLDESRFPVYFQNIVEQELIVASDAREHSATSCFNHAYFEPNNIYSLLDFVLQKNYKPAGIICCESKEVRASWSAQDIEHIRMVAALISFFFEV